MFENYSDLFSKVIGLSETFIDQLNKCRTNCEETYSADHSIGKSFIQTEPEFRRVYGNYCINHDNAQFLLEKVIDLVLSLLLIMELT